MKIVKFKRVGIFKNAGYMWVKETNPFFKYYLKDNRTFIKVKEKVVK